MRMAVNPSFSMSIILFRIIVLERVASIFEMNFLPNAFMDMMGSILSAAIASRDTKRAYRASKLSMRIRISDGLHADGWEEISLSIS